MSAVTIDTAFEHARTLLAPASRCFLSSAWVAAMVPLDQQDRKVHRLVCAQHPLLAGTWAVQLPDRPFDEAGIVMGLDFKGKAVAVFGRVIAVDKPNFYRVATVDGVAFGTGPGYQQPGELAREMVFIRAWAATQEACPVCGDGAALDGSTPLMVGRCCPACATEGWTGASPGEDVLRATGRAPA